MKVEEMVREFVSENYQMIKVIVRKILKDDEEIGCE